MELWKVTYTRTSKVSVDRCVMYWYSPDGSTLTASVQNYWEKVHLGYYVVSNVKVELNIDPFPMDRVIDTLPV